jgi:outer membrane protein assembly factor BamA
VPDGAQVTHVDVHGVGIDGAQVLALLQTKAGTRLDHDRLRADVRLLWKLGVASQIAVSAQPDTNGYAIDLALRPPPRVIGVELAGATRAQLPMFVVLEGTLHDNVRLQGLATATTTWLHGRGYADATIEATPTVECDGVMVHVTALLGPRYTIDQLEIAGSVVPAPAAMFEHELGTVNVVGGTYTESSLLFDLDELVSRHRRSGWLDVATDVPKPTYHHDRGTVSIAVKIIAGKRYRFGALTATGGTEQQRRFVEARLATLHGWYDERALSAVERDIGDALLAQHSNAYSTLHSDSGHGVIDMSFQIAKVGS